jgi:hypothetical protein
MRTGHGAAIVTVCLAAGLCACSRSDRAFYVSCDGPTKLVLRASVYRHPFDFELGDAMGWGLFYSTPDGTLPLYDDGYLAHDVRPPTVSLPYVGWSYQDSRFKGPAPTFTYAPLPRGADRTVRIVDPGALVGAPESSGQTQPPYMNIFVRPGRMTPEAFSHVAECLKAHAHDLNVALVKLREHFPGSDKHFYKTLRIGGIVDGTPPYDDAAYMQLLSASRGARSIPDHGRILVYPGSPASGEINGHDVRASAGPNGADLTVDGIVVAYRRDGNTNVPGVRQFGSDGWLIEGPPCTDTKVGGRCGKAIAPLSRNGDGSVTFSVALRIGENTYADYATPECPLPPC